MILSFIISIIIFLLFGGHTCWCSGVTPGSGLTLGRIWGYHIWCQELNPDILGTRQAPTCSSSKVRFCLADLDFVIVVVIFSVWGGRFLAAHGGPCGPGY